MFSFPIKEPYKITQRFGENLLNYAQFGLKGHNGIDIACSRGTAIYAPIKGLITQIIEGYKPGMGGYGNLVRFITSIADEHNKFYDMVFGHLLTVNCKPQEWMEEGQLIGLADTTGFSTGDHLHWGVRKLERRQPNAGEATVTYFNNTYTYLDYNNGYYGYFDFEELVDIFTDEVWPVDQRYSQEYSWLREQAWELRHGKYARKRAKKESMTLHFEQIKKAFVYGYWDAETVFQPAMFQLWATMTKPEFHKRLRNF